MSRSNTSRVELKRARRVVVKVGSGVLTREGRLHPRTLGRLAAEISRASKHSFVLVSSGAIALGIEAMGLKARPRDVVGLQAAAAVGQAKLVDRWSRAFARNGRVVGQVLLTHDDFSERGRYLNARHTLNRLLGRKIVPIINENDSVSVEEIRLGDNDHLAGLTVGLIGADLLVLLSDVDGLYDDDPGRNPQARFISTVDGSDPDLLSMARGARSAVGTGGMLSKLRSARMASQLGVPVVIASGRRSGVLGRILRGEDEGTFVRPAEQGLLGRKGWLAHATRPRGRIVVDAGARRALVRDKRSLLPAGVCSVTGSFGEGDPVEVVDEKGQVFALGLAVYSADDVRRLAGSKSGEIAALLGFKTLDEVIHRDDLVMV